MQVWHARRFPFPSWLVRPRSTIFMWLENVSGTGQVRPRACRDQLHHYPSVESRSGDDGFLLSLFVPVSVNEAVPLRSQLARGGLGGMGTG